MKVSELWDRPATTFLVTELGTGSYSAVRIEIAEVGNPSAGNTVDVGEGVALEVDEPCSIVFGVVDNANLKIAVDPAWAIMEAKKR